jgi:hypothetical protein
MSDIIERAEAALEGHWPGTRIVSPARFFGGLVRDLVAELKASRIELRASRQTLMGELVDCQELLKAARATHNLSSDASASASDERPGATSPTTPEVEVAPGLPNIADTTIAQACERIDILEQEVEALQRENARLKSWLVR